MSRTGASRLQSGWAANRNKSSGSTQKTASFQKAQGYDQFEYVESPPLVQNVKPEDRVIKTEGEHVLSSEPSGVSKLHFYPQFLSTLDADGAFACLMEEVPWVQNSDKYGPQPRLTAWYGDHPYSYSGLTHTVNPQWHPILESIRQQIEVVTGKTFNSVLCNQYRDNHDGVDWHCDDEPALRQNPYIASISLGAVRVFELRKKPPPESGNDFSTSQLVKMHLPHGSLVIMEGSTQNDWQHRVPKEFHDRGPRINLTYRTIYPPD